MARSFLRNLLWGPDEVDYEANGYHDDGGLPPEPDPDAVTEEEAQPRQSSRRGRGPLRSDDVIEMRAPSRPQTEIHYPRSFDDARALADQFKLGSLLIVDLEQVEEKDRARLVHFLCGVAYGRDGRSERINELTFMFAPRFFDVEAQGRSRETRDSEYPLPRYKVPGQG